MSADDQLDKSPTARFERELNALLPAALAVSAQANESRQATARRIIKVAMLVVGPHLRPADAVAYQWAWRLGDITRPCRDEQNAREEVARFPAARVLVRRRVGPWEAAGAVPAPAATEGPGER